VAGILGLAGSFLGRVLDGIVVVVVEIAVIEVGAGRIVVVVGAAGIVVVVEIVVVVSSEAVVWVGRHQRNC
jgi:hypothetical protein